MAVGRYGGMAVWRYGGKAVWWNWANGGSGASSEKRNLIPSAARDLLCGIGERLRKSLLGR
jgi:hypothetical protein